MPYLESISPSRSIMLEDSSRHDGETPLTLSGKARLVAYGLLLAMASKRVGCSHFCVCVLVRVCVFVFVGAYVCGSVCVRACIQALVCA